MPDTPASRSRQIRLRATEAEKAHIDTAAAQAGYDNVSDYLRPIILERHVLVIDVAPGAEEPFLLVPAFSADEDQRAAALLAIEEMLGRLQSELNSPQGTLDLPLPPEASEGVAARDGAEPAGAGGDHGPVGAEPQPASAEAAQVPDPAPPVAQPAAAPQPAVPSGPIPAPEESMDVFVARRGRELAGLGTPPLRAHVEAEAEWRRYLAEQAQAQAVPAPTPEPSVDAPAAPANPAFCPHCGTPNAGTRFCAGCGASLA